MTTQNDSTDTHTSVQPHYAPQLDVLYRPEVSFEGNDENHASRTPTKARRFLEHVADQKLSDYLNILREFGPLANSEFLRAHTREYVEAFFRGEEPHASSNGLEWSPEFAESVRYTNSSLVHAVENALAHPARISLSPTGGFHHATPESGRGFCSMSGQAIAALRVYEQRGAVGAWFDLDGHFGNSIEDTRSHAPLLDQALPRDLHINPQDSGSRYIENLRAGIARVGRAVLRGEVHYLAFAHGADSHEWDDLGGQCTTEEWLRASRLVYSAIEYWSRTLGRPIPVVLAFFGGYRDDDAASVLELHAADLAIALRTLAGVSIDYVPRVKRPARRR